MTLRASCDHMETFQQPHLPNCFDDPQLKVYLQLELFVVVDFGLSFVQATYKLEGDGALYSTSVL